MKKLLSLLLIALFMATLLPVSAQDGYSEAPMLAEMVEAGELPPVEERLPVEPVVIDTEVEIGQYGGAWRTWDTGFDTGSCTESNFRSGKSYQFVYRNPRTGAFTPNVLSSWELSEDQTTVTVTLREGIKWSDGYPVTTEDIVFWWEDLMLNEELNPQIDRNFTTTDENGEPVPMQVEAVDEYTAKYIFQHPYPAFIDKFATSKFLSPKHYLKDFLPAYNEEVPAMAEAEGYETWVEYYGAISDGGIGQTNTDLPQLRAWVLESVDSTNSKVYVRNPYFWKVDSEGNQLPYIDRYERIVVESEEIGFARSLTGEFTFARIQLLSDLPLAKREEERGGFTVELFPAASAADGYAFSFNYTIEDEMLKEIFNDLRFRKAISYSINREEWNELFHLGLGEPRQGIPGPDTSFYVEGIDKMYTEYDVDLANELLDEIGLEWLEGEEYRTLPNGEPFIIETQVMKDRADKWEIMKGYWKEIGVGLEYKPVEAQLLREQLQTNELPIGSWGGGGAGEFYAHANRPIRYMPPWHWPTLPQGGLLWSIWHDTNGEEGEEPPEIIKELFDAVDAWLRAPYGSDEYLELGEKIITINAENLWWFGVVGYDPTAWMIDANVHNLPPEDTRVAVDVCGAFGDYLPEQFWIAE